MNRSELQNAGELALVAIEEQESAAADGGRVDREADAVRRLEPERLAPIALPGFVLRWWQGGGQADALDRRRERAPLDRQRAGYLDAQLRVVALTDRRERQSDVGDAHAEDFLAQGDHDLDTRAVREAERGLEHLERETQVKVRTDLARRQAAPDEAVRALSRDQKRVVLRDQLPLELLRGECERPLDRSEAEAGALDVRQLRASRQQLVLLPERQAEGHIGRAEELGIRDVVEVQEEAHRGRRLAFHLHGPVPAEWKLGFAAGADGKEEARSAVVPRDECEADRPGDLGGRRLVEHVQRIALLADREPLIIDDQPFLPGLLHDDDRVITERVAGIREPALQGTRNRAGIQVACETLLEREQLLLGLRVLRLEVDREDPVRYDVAQRRDIRIETIPAIQDLGFRELRRLLREDQRHEHTGERQQERVRHVAGVRLRLQLHDFAQAPEEQRMQPDAVARECIDDATDLVDAESDEIVVLETVVHDRECLGQGQRRRVLVAMLEQTREHDQLEEQLAQRVLGRGLGGGGLDEARDGLDDLDRVVNNREERLEVRVGPVEVRTHAVQVLRGDLELCAARRVEPEVGQDQLADVIITEVIGERVDNVDEFGDGALNEVEAVGRDRVRHGSAQFRL